MKHLPFSRVALAEDLPTENLRRGDVATVVECYEGEVGQEPGYELEVFNVLGETVAVVTVRESQVAALRAGEVFNARSREMMAG